MSTSRIATAPAPRKKSSARCNSSSCPGRSSAKDEIIAMAATLRRDYGATRIAAFMEEAAEVYEKRGLFKARY